MAVKTARVEKVTATKTGVSVKLHFADPPPDGHDEVFTEVTEEQWDIFVKAYPGDVEVDIDETTTPPTFHSVSLGS